MGLLGDSWDDPKTQATLQLAAGLLGGGNFGQALGKGLSGYQQTLQADEDRKLTKLMKDAQLAALKDQSEQRQIALQQAKTNQEFISRLGRGAVPDSLQIGPVAEGSASGKPYDSGMGVLQSMSIDQVAALSQATGKDYLPMWRIAKEGLSQKAGDYVLNANTGEREFLANPKDGIAFKNGVVSQLPGFAQSNALIKGAEAYAVEGAKAGLDPMKVFNTDTQREEFVPRSVVATGGQALGNQPGPNPQEMELILRDAEANGIKNPVIGAWNQNRPQQQPRFAAGPSASEVAANEANKKGAEGLATASVDLLKNSFEQAKGAAASLGTIRNIENILADKKLMLGPGSDARVAIARLGNTLGVGGKDDAEKLSNTTMLMQQLSQMQLNSAKQMAGQGTITDAERKLIEQTAAGKTNFTAGELQTLAGALKKTAQNTIGSHSSLVDRMSKNPLYANQIDAFRVDAPMSAPSGGAKFLGFESGGQ